VLATASLPMAPTGRLSEGRQTRVLVAGADAAVAAPLGARLRAEGFSVQVSNNAARAQSTFERIHPDLVLLDIDGTGARGWQLLEHIREHDSVPVVIMSEHTYEQDIVAALERGADDYVTKPLAFDELLARMRVGLRRSRRARQPITAGLRIGDLEFDVEQRRVLRGGQLVRLTPTEYALIALFARHPDKLLTDRMLREAVWGERPASTHLLHVYIARLRQKLEEDPVEPQLLLTEPGAGYLLATHRSSFRG
jgi:two-component system, OmpR family, KDP operon response regulator KdpE